MSSEGHKICAFPSALADTGMSLWDYFAAHAPLPSTGGATKVPWNSWELARAAADYADAIMRERAKRLGVKP